MNNFITNSSYKSLKNRLARLIKNSKELKFLVGFFYFSGIRELYNSLKENPNFNLKILVGLAVENFNYQLIEFAEGSNSTDKEKIHKFFDSIKKSINTQIFDNQEFYEQVLFFVELIKNDRIVIRKTYNPNHAKLYLFKFGEEKEIKEHLFITGSSNLTGSGLVSQEEFNVEIGDYGFEDAEEYFDELWDDAVKITEKPNSKKRLVELIENETLIRKITPFEAYVLILKTYLDSYEGKSVGENVINTLEKNNYKPYSYQVEAVEQALSILEQHNGVIIADVVGLGKTIIACAIAKQLKKRGIVLAPPGLIGDKNSGWTNYLEQFGLASLGWEAWSSGDLEKPLEFLEKADDVEVVIIDEVHRFRNQDTASYEQLRNICRNKYVILLTATPFNNRPADILSLLKLFIVPKKSTITLGENLVDQFRAFKSAFDKLGFIKKHWNDPENSVKKRRANSFYQTLFGETGINITKVVARTRYLAKQIRNVIEPVTIRRNRLDIKLNPNYSKEVEELSEIAPPKEWFFELTKEQSKFYDEIIRSYFSDPNNGGKFKGAIYQPFIYEKGISDDEDLSLEENREYIQQRNLFEFMRRLMVKRFESSFGSFEQSVRNFLKTIEIVQEFISKKNEYILDRSLIEKIYTKDIDEIEEYLREYEEKIKAGQYPTNHKRYKLDNDFKFKNEFIRDIENDRKMFKEILKKLDELELATNDPKAECLMDNLEREFNEKPNHGEPKRKILIFSEYVDTVNHLETILNKKFGDRLLVVSGNLSKSKVKLINKNFDASLPENEQEDKYDILLSSDKISEGFNLNRAGMVINYDIPWNPVRVIQRVGRINRISKKVFDFLYIVNFFPTEQGAELVKSRDIAQNKMYLIHNALGEDAQIFDADEEPTPSKLYQKIQKTPDEYEKESFYTKILNEYTAIRKKNPELIEEIKKFPVRIKTAKFFNENELLVFYKKGKIYTGIYNYNNEEGVDNPSFIDFEEAYEKIKCHKEEKLLDWNTEQFWNAYEQLKNLREAESSSAAEQSIEQRALNKLRYLIDKCENEKLIPYKDFLRTLREDILDYGTLSDYTVRRIANLEDQDEKIDEAIKEIRALIKELGKNYLYKEADRIKSLSKEIIIAVENKNSE